MTSMAADVSQTNGEIERLTTVLENLGTNVLLADTDRTLIYMNQKSKETLGELDKEIRAQMGLSVDELVGDSIPCFHGASTHRIAALLGNPGNLPHLPGFAPGDRVLEVRAVTSSTGEYALRKEHRALFRTLRADYACFALRQPGIPV